MKITHIEHSKINKYKWDNCIRHSFNGIVYAFSWYLDKVCEDWEALIAGDYELVMPLTSQKKYKISFLVQPYYTQQLGVFSTKRLMPETLSYFIEAIPQKYRFININLNTFNNIEINDFTIYDKITYELDLIEGYKKLYSKFSTNTRRNIKKSEKNKVSISPNISASELLNLKKNNSAIPYTDDIMSTARRVISAALIKHIGKIYGAYTDRNTLCAAAFFISTHNKAIYLIGASTEEGKTNGTMTAIMNFYIKENAEKNLTLDFEGSNIESVARFFKGFGAKKCSYQNLQRNNLPWYLKLFKS